MANKCLRQNFTRFDKECKIKQKFLYRNACIRRRIHRASENFPHAYFCIKKNKTNE